MRGGWRWNAGRPAQHGKVERSLRLSAKDADKHGLLSGGYAVWSWKNAETGEPLASVAVHGGADRIVLEHSASGTPIRQPVAIERTPCHFGGYRPWFRCPDCWGPVGVLYIRGSRFTCRVCAGLRYRSQSEDECGRSWRK